MRAKQILTSSVLTLFTCLVGATAIAGDCGGNHNPCPKNPGVNYTQGHCAPYLKSSKLAPWLRSECEAPYKKSCGMAPYVKTMGEASYRKSGCEAPYIRTGGEAPFLKTCGMAPYIIRLCEPPCYPPEQKGPPKPCVIPTGCPSR
ncbi:MAG: hypothetical protein M1511_02010 [Deltaproteobacteria bacterium]|nr:hypothetical protein [Deltaproteobacteria bacterium]